MNEKQVIINAMKKNANDNGYFLCSDQQLSGEIIIKNEINHALAMHHL